MSGFPDPFLARHHGRGTVFALFGHNPQSIRDQMLRAVMMVDRARQIRLIGPGRPPLIVVGGGAAGATAALRAATKHKVRTILLEQKDELFSRQGTFTSRFVCPTQYDFPVRHWLKARYPWEISDEPLGWSAGSAHTIAARWRDDFKILSESPSGRAFLDVRTNADCYRIESLNEQRYSTHIGWEEDGELVSKEAGMVILATGYGKERVASPDDAPEAMVASPGPRFRCPTFWARDELECASYDDRELTRGQATVVVSGGGDGGLQDILRICFARPAHRVFQKLFFDGADAAVKKQYNDILETLAVAEEKAQWALYMAGPGLERDRVLRGLEQCHRALIAQIVLNPSLLRRVHGTIHSVLVDPAPEALFFVHDGDFFSQCYGLNRFLVRLLLTRPFKPAWVHDRPGVRVESVVGRNGHACADDAGACFARPHLVTLSNNATIKADIVVLRHGFYNEDGSRTSAIQDVLPYSLPGF